ncbi:MAG: VWA domain-containing protein [Candidatus Aminicenantes bacterium]|nr:VWA domain-containing protein [Candidatus Aminicenantes bacterium]
MLIFEPAVPWSYIAAAAFLLAAALLLLRGAIDYKRGVTPWKILGANRFTRFFVLGCSLSAALLLALSALNPYVVRKPAAGGAHLQVVVDVSESVQRAGGGWARVRSEACERMAASTAALKKDLRNRSSAGIITFSGHTAITRRKRPLKKLAEDFKLVNKSDFAGGAGTNIEAGLRRAGELVDEAGGFGAVLLISDGNETNGDAAAAARQLARRGIPVHVYPVMSRGPALAITDADLPRHVFSEVETYLRGLVLNSRSAAVKANLTIEQNPRSPGISRGGALTQSTKKEFSLSAGSWSRLRVPLLFKGCGLQFVDLKLSSAGSKEPHLRRFFTHVKRPPQVLAVGGDNYWAAAIPGDLLKVIQLSPKEASRLTDLEKFDAVVIDGVPAQQLQGRFLPAVARMVKQRGGGLFLINGAHRGFSEKDGTVLMSYQETPLEPLLPVISDPRLFRREPPTRQVAILIDTSGSMGNWRIEMAKKIAAYIVSNLLRPRDRLDLITFTTGAGHLVKNRKMDAAGKQAALRQIDAITTGGGTDPNRALDLIGSRKMTSCGLIFISDGEFGHVAYRPDCRATVFAIGRGTVPTSSPLFKLADPFSVMPGFDPSSIRIPYFQPEEKRRFFVRGEYEPLSMSAHLRKSLRLPVPQLPLDGTALTKVKEDAVLQAVRPKRTDPVLVFRRERAGGAYAGVFTTGIPRSWVMRRQGREAVAAWIRRLIPYMERDRYDFKLADRGFSIDLRVSLVPKNGRVPLVESMTADVRFRDPADAHLSVGVPLQADIHTPGVFYGQISVPRGDETRQAELILGETGEEAVERAQRIPLLIPPAGLRPQAPSTEDAGYGRNRVLLEQIAAVGGGIYDPPAGTPFFSDRPVDSRSKPLWPFLIALAVLFYIAAIAAKRWNP